MIKNVNINTYVTTGFESFAKTSDGNYWFIEPILGSNPAYNIRYSNSNSL
jgi:nitrous oxidase accessory protein NosD